MQSRIYEIDLGYLGKTFVEVALVFTTMFRLVEEIPKSKYKCQNCVRALHYILHELLEKNLSNYNSEKKKLQQKPNI